jgi:DNA-binding NarL/FixJ family response regulator
MVRVPVYVFGPDSITVAGVMGLLRGRPEIHIVEDSPDHAEVALICYDTLDDDAVRSCRATQRNGCPRMVLLLNQVTDQELLLAVNVGASGLVRRGEATSQKLVDSIVTAARGEATMPADLLQTLLCQVKDSQDERPGSGLSWQLSLSDRETEVLRLVAEGWDTRQIATELSYSERTIKNIIQDVTRRFGLRNRSHAVAYVLRRGLI